MAPTLFEQGLTLMLVGMGTVFVFLAVLVMSMSLLAAIAKRWLHEPQTAGVSDDEVAAISAAITQHRKNHSR